MGKLLLREKEYCAQWRSIIFCIKPWNLSGFLTLITFAVVFLYIVCFSTFSNIAILRTVGNALFVVYIVLSFLAPLSKKERYFSWFAIFFAFFVFYIYFFGLISRRPISYLPFLYCLAAVGTFNFVSSLSHQDKVLFGGAVYFGYCIFTIIIFAYYFPEIIKNGIQSSRRYGSEFGNQDFVASCLGSAIVFGLYFLREKTLTPLFFLPFQFFLLALTLTRSPYLYLIPCVVAFFVSFGKSRKAKLWIFLVSLFFLIGSFFAFLTFPIFRSVAEKIIVAIQTIFGFGQDASTLERMALLRRSYLYGLLHGFYGYGFNGIYDYGYIYPHDGYGDLAIPFGGFFAFFVFLFIGCIMAYSLKRKNSYSLLLLFAFFLFIVSFFTGTPFTSRLSYIFYPFCISLSLGDEKAGIASLIFKHQAKARVGIAKISI